MVMLAAQTMIALAAILFSPSIGCTQARIVFSGIPSVKISEGGLERQAVSVSPDRAVGLRCIISRIEDTYYWASRENKEMARIEAGAFITFFSVDGSGYVRLVAPGMKEAVSLMGEAEKKFDYVEHLLIGLKSVTYYGSKK